jgi:aryl-alcohol dehydrogenase-like predicted oxidoreductase
MKSSEVCAFTNLRVSTMNYRILGRSGLRVSELCLGTMTFGTEWGTGADAATSRAIFEAFVEAGGNFIDTANRYTEGTSERLLGEFIASDRDRYVVATKYSLYTGMGDINSAGNHRKSMVRAVEDSLRRLQTDYIDLYWLHAWDGTTPVDEVMYALEALVKSGKILHIGISDTPAWVVARANTLAELRGWSQFVGLQVEYSLALRDAERDLIPMAEAFGLTVLPWSPLAGGMLSGKYAAGAPIEQARLKPESPRLSERNARIVSEVVDIAASIGCTPVHVALAWIRQQQPISIPIIGARTLKQVQEALGCLTCTLDERAMQRLDEVSSIDVGFPHDFLQRPGIVELLFAGQRAKLDV